MKKLEYYHMNSYNGQRYTVTMEPPSKEELLALIPNFQTEIKAKIGIAFVHPLDEYKKKTGREEAIKKMEEVSLILKRIDNRDNKRWFFEFGTIVTGNVAGRKLLRNIEIGLSIHKTGKDTRIRYVFLNN